MSGGQGTPVQAAQPAQGNEQLQMLQMLRQAMPQPQQVQPLQPMQMPSWQPRTLHQAWSGMNDPRQFAQQQAERQQALRGMQQVVYLPAQPALPESPQPGGVPSSGVPYLPGYTG